MNLLITIILCVIINILSKFIIKNGKELLQIIKLKKQFNNSSQFNIEDFNINKDFWEDLKNEDISTDRDNE